MKKKVLKTAIAVLVIAIAILTAFWGGFGVGIYQPEPEPEPTKVVTVPKPIEPVKEHMELGEMVYYTEIYDDGKVVVTTTQKYINQLSEHTIVITDLSLDDIPQEILDVMDVPE